MDQLNVDLLREFFVLAAGEIKANQTDDLFVGNINGAGGPATVVVTGTVNAVDVFKNGNLTVNTNSAGSRSSRGGTINNQKRSFGGGSRFGRPLHDERVTHDRWRSEHGPVGRPDDPSELEPAQRLMPREA